MDRAWVRVRARARGNSGIELERAVRGLLSMQPNKPRSISELPPRAQSVDLLRGHSDLPFSSYGHSSAVRPVTSISVPRTAGAMGPLDCGHMDGDAGRDADKTRSLMVSILQQAGVVADDPVEVGIPLIHWHLVERSH